MSFLSSLHTLHKFINRYGFTEFFPLCGLWLPMSLVSFAEQKFQLINKFQYQYFHRL